MAATQRPSQQETRRQELQGIIKEMREKRMPVVTQLLARFDEVKMAPAAVVEAEAEVEAAAAAQEVVAKAPSRRQEKGRSKARCFDTNEARRGRTEKSDSRRKEQRGELLQEKRLGHQAPLVVEAPMRTPTRMGCRSRHAQPPLCPRKRTAHGVTWPLASLGTPASSRCSSRD